MENPGENSRSALDIYNKEYLPARRLARQNVENNPERLKIKSDIADKIQEGDNSVNEHFNKLGKRVERDSSLKVEEFASNISDGLWQSPKREPSLVESVLATEEFDKLYVKITDDIGDRAVDIARIGSSFWGQNYSLRGKERGDASDIDMEIIVDAVPEDLSYADAQVLRQFKKYFEAGEADYCALKREMDGIEVSFHVMPLATFEKMCRLDYENVDKPYYLKEFRPTAGIKPKTYKQKNFAGEVFSYLTEPQSAHSGQISEVPLVMIGNHGELVLGVVLNKYLPLPEFAHKSGVVQEGLAELVASLRRRKNLDQARLPDKKLSFEFFHSHSEQMPEWIKNRLKALD